MSIVSFNCKNVKRGIQSVRDLTKTEDIIVLQETWLLPHDLNFMHQINSDFGLVAKSSMDTSVGILKGRPYGGLAILWNKVKFPNVTPVECPCDRIMAVKVSVGSGSFLIVNVYMPVNDESNLAEFTNCLGLANAIVEESDVQVAYVIGDFNAHPSKTFGLELKRFCEDLMWECADINILGGDSDTYTFISDAHGTQSWLDHCLTTEAAWKTVVSANVIYDVTWSDHFPLRIVCEIASVAVGSINSDKPDALKNIRWGERDPDQIKIFGKYCYENLNNCDNFKFICNCDNILSCPHLNDYFKYIDSYYNHIVKVIQEAAIKSARPKRKNCRKVIGWNYHVKDSHRAARLYFSCWVMAGKPPKGEIFNKMRNSRSEFKNKVKWCQKNEEMIKINILATHRRSNNFSKFWNATKKLNYKQNLPVSMDGVQKPLPIAEMFANKFKVNPQPARSVPATNPLFSEHPEVTVKAVRDAVRNMKRGKSPGHDGLGIEHILYASDTIFEHLSIFYNLCIKYSYLPSDLMRTIVIPIVKNKTGDLSSSSNYRPISLGTVIGKVLERLIYPELKNIKIDDAQFGFRAGLSTDSAIIGLKSTVNYYTSQDTSVYACFLDLSRAFDLVNYDILWAKLSDAQVPNHVVNLLRYWYENQINNVKWGDTTSSDYRLECGVRQGGLTSPDLFNLYVNDLIGELRRARTGCHLGNVCVNNLSYADDMVLLSPSIKGLRKLLLICEQYAIDHGLKYNVAKTEMMVFRSGRGPEKVHEVHMNGSTIQMVKQFKYLGHLLTESMKDDNDIERERRALAVRGNMLARRFANCNPDVKNTLFKAYCLGMYTCQLWSNYTRKSLNIIRVQYNNAFRALMRLPRYCSASTMFSDAGVPDFFSIIRSRIAAFWNRLSRSNNSILRAVFDYLPNPIYKHWISVHMDENRK